MAQLNLNRNELAKFLPDAASIRQFEELFSTTNASADQIVANTGEIGTLTARVIGTTAPLTGGGDLSADRTIAMAAATAAVDGYLTAANFSIFFGKQDALGFTPINKAGDTGIGDLGMTKFGCNGATPQGKATINAASTDLPTVIALCNQLRSLLIANGQAV